MYGKQTKLFYIRDAVTMQIRLFIISTKHFRDSIRTVLFINKKTYKKNYLNLKFCLFKKKNESLLHDTQI